MNSDSDGHRGADTNPDVDIVQPPQLLEFRPTADQYASVMFPKLCCYPRDFPTPEGVSEEYRYVWNTKQRGAECPYCRLTCTTYAGNIQRTAEMIPKDCNLTPQTESRPVSVRRWICLWFRKQVLTLQSLQ